MTVQAFIYEPLILVFRRRLNLLFHECYIIDLGRCRRFELEVDLLLQLLQSCILLQDGLLASPQLMIPGLDFLGEMYAPLVIDAEVAAHVFEICFHSLELLHLASNRSLINLILSLLITALIFQLRDE